MKITRIELCNLASIEGEAVIDFEKEPLLSAGIFAISGPTGSGKSTILDALCLALYDKIPRFEISAGTTKVSDGGDSEISQNDVRNILRRGMANGYAEVDFIGINEIRYRSRWTVKRSYNKPDGKLQAQTLVVYDLTNGIELQGTKTELLQKLSQAIGLSYEQFTRTVLLAQNDFATFLKSNEKDKAELLEKLTGTEIYSKISQLIYARNKEEQGLIKKIETQMEVVQILPPEKVESIQTRYEGVKKESIKLRDQLQTCTKRDEAFKKKFDIEKSIAQTRDKIKENNKKKESSLLRKEESKKQKEVFENDWELLEPQIELAISLDTKISTKKEQLTTLRHRFDSSSKELESKQRRDKIVTDRLNNSISALKNLYEELRIPESVGKKVADVIGYLQAQVHNYTLKQAEYNKELQSLKIEKVYDKQKEINLSKVNLNKLSSDFREFNRVLKERETLEKELETLTKTKKSKDEELTNYAQSLEKTQIQFNHSADLYRKSQIRVSNNVISLRELLEPGKECPVCGSTQHFFHTATIKSDFSVLEQSYKELTTKVNILQTKKVGVEKELDHLAKDLAKVKKDLADKKDHLEALQSLYEKSVFSEAYIEKQTEELSIAESKINSVILNYNKVIEERDKIIQAKEQIYKDQSRLNDSFNAYKEAKSESTLAIKEVEASSKLLTEIKEELDKEQAILSSQTKERKSLLRGKTVEEIKRDYKAKTEKFKVVFEAFQKEESDLLTERATIEGQLLELDQNLLAYKSQLKDISEKENSATLKELSNQIELIDKELNNCYHLLQQDKENRKKFDVLLKQKEKQLVIAEEWGRLNTLLGSSDGAKFKVIAQSYTLKILLLHANKHLSYLARRYRLEQVGDSLSLQVIDCDMCDEVRTVLSLSGGESFLISLALALGLSSLSSNNLKVESLFIDEGFGSLDADSLRTAMDALEQLQMQGRKIGVISHVQEMSERIAIQIRLEKEASGKSKIMIN